MPGKGKYTLFNTNNSRKKEHLARLFSGGEIDSPFAGKDAKESLEEAVTRGNELLRAGSTSGVVETGDSTWGNGTGKVDLTYGGSYSSASPPNGVVVTERPGDPMNAFVPDISSPGAGASGESATELGEVKVEGTDKTRNPKLKPEEYFATRGKTFVETAGTKMPKSTSERVYGANILGEENKFNTTSPNQYPE
jgi:hypothetical protein